MVHLVFRTKCNIFQRYFWKSKGTEHWVLALKKGKGPQRNGRRAMESLLCNDSYMFDTQQMCFRHVCLAVVCDAIWRIIYVVVSLLVWLCLNLSSDHRYERMSPYFYPGHIFRWMIYPLVLIVLLTSIFEGVFSGKTFFLLEFYHGPGILVQQKYECHPRNKLQQNI